VVELLLAVQQTVQQQQELAGLGALDDPVVVRAGDGHQLGAGDIPDGTGGDDRALSLHETRYRSHRPDRAGVGEGDGPAHVGVGHELAVSRTLHQALVLLMEIAEAHGLGLREDGDHEPTRSVLPHGVHGEAEIHTPGIDLEVVLALPCDGSHHGRDLFRRLHQRPPDEVGERELEALGLELAVESGTHGPQERNVDLAERGRRGELERRLHVLQ
jgi:hypothetical protein